MVKYGNDPAKVQAKVDARQAAEAGLALLQEALEGDSNHFWKIVRDFAETKVALSTKISDLALTDIEASRFGAEEMPFGKYQGIPINSVPLQYLDWLVGEADDFRAKMRRYLLNDGVRERIRSELEEKEPRYESAAD